MRRFVQCWFGRRFSSFIIDSSFALFELPWHARHAPIRIDLVAVAGIEKHLRIAAITAPEGNDFAA